MNINLTFFIQFINALVSIFAIRRYLITPFLANLERKSAVIKRLEEQKNNSQAKALELQNLASVELRNFQRNIINHEKLNFLISANQSNYIAAKNDLRSNYESVNQDEVTVLSNKILELVHDLR